VVVDDIWREGSFPAIIPNTGSDVLLAWAPADFCRFGEVLKAAFPGIVFYETFLTSVDGPEPPKIRWLDRLDAPDVTQGICAFIPYPGWEPRLVQQLRPPGGPPKFFWTFDRYLSPKFRISSFPGLPIGHSDWRGRAASAPIEYWRYRGVAVSYRKALPDEVRIAAKFIRLAKKLCVRTVPVAWDSCAHFRAGDGRVIADWHRFPPGWASQAAVDWCRAAQGRVIGLSPDAQPEPKAFGYMPADCVPDAWWGAKSRPKWAQLP
jgi:hypothetical protein